MQPTVWVAADVLAWCEAEAGRTYPKETGGVLMGWHRRQRREIVVVHAIGPGERGIHQSHRFEPDNSHHVAAVGDVYQLSGRKVTYLGDWHSHPGGSPTLSRTDRRTLGAIAEHEPSRCPHPVMLVLGGSPENGWQAVAHGWAPRHLWVWRLPGSQTLPTRSWQPGDDELAGVGYPFR